MGDVAGQAFADMCKAVQALSAIASVYGLGKGKIGDLHKERFEGGSNCRVAAGAFCGPMHELYVSRPPSWPTVSDARRDVS